MEIFLSLRPSYTVTTVSDTDLTQQPRNGLSLCIPSSQTEGAEAIVRSGLCQQQNLKQISKLIIPMHLCCWSVL